MNGDNNNNNNDDDDAAFLASLAQVEESLAKRPRVQGSFSEAKKPSPSPLAPSTTTTTTPSPRPSPPTHASPVCFAIWDRHRFSVGKNFPPALTSFFREWPLSVWDEGSKTFHFPLKQYGAMVGALRAMQYAVIQEPPRAVLELFAAPPQQKPPGEALQEDRIPRELLEALFPFQRKGVEFIVGRGGRGLIGDEMGLGKTVQAIAVAAYFRDEWPVLVVCPSSLRIAWGQQFEKWLPRESRGINIVMQQKRARLNAPINIVSFSLATNMGVGLLAQKFQVVIVDESHYLKSTKTKRTRAVLPVLKAARRVVLLSGTPAVSRPSELFTQLNCLEPTLFPAFPAFGVRYCNARSMPWGMDYTGSSNSKELNAVLSTLMIRRKKDEVLDQLPEKTRQKVLLQVDSKSLNALRKQMQNLTAAKDIMFNADSRSVAGRASSLRTGVFLELFQNVGRAKLPAVVEYLKELLDGDEGEAGPKFLVFAHHKDVIEGISHALDAAKHDHIRIDGATPSGRRQVLVDYFQNTPSCRVAVLSILAAGVGLTMTAASFVLFAELYFVPGVIMQAEGRAHRIGQQNRVWVHYLVARHTVDEQIFRLLNRKISVLGETLDGVSGKQLEFAEGADAEIHREELGEGHADGFLTELLGLLQQQGGGEDDGRGGGEDYGDDDEDDYGGPAAGGDAAEAEEDEEAVLDHADDVLRRVQEKKQSSLSKFAQFQFGQ